MKSKKTVQQRVKEITKMVNRDPSQSSRHAQTRAKKAVEKAPKHAPITQQPTPIADADADA
jgi:hypothetical protein